VTFDQVYRYFRYQASKAEPLPKLAAALCVRQMPRVSQEDCEYSLRVLCAVLEHSAWCCIVRDHVSGVEFFKVQPLARANGPDVNVLRQTCAAASQRKAAPQSAPLT
jgi:hypothetical protein